MKRKINVLFSAILIMLLVMSNVVYAQESYTESNKAGARAIARSRYLAGVTAEITNKGEGVLGIYAHFTSYESVEEAIITVHLERWSDSLSDWVNVKDYEKSFTRSSGELTSGTYSFSVSGYATGYYYRLNCDVSVRSAASGWESKTATTDGVLLTSTPAMRLPDLDQ